MVQFSVYEAKASFSSLLKRVAQGEEVVITRAGAPYVRLLPYFEKGTGRIPGQDRGCIDMTHFDDPLPDELAVPFGCATDQSK